MPLTAVFSSRRPPRSFTGTTTFRYLCVVYKFKLSLLFELGLGDFSSFPKPSTDRFSEEALSDYENCSFCCISASFLTTIRRAVSASS